jgi:hypothetical protein
MLHMLTAILILPSLASLWCLWIAQSRQHPSAVANAQSAKTQAAVKLPVKTQAANPQFDSLPTVACETAGLDGDSHHQTALFEPVIAAIAKKLPIISPCISRNVAVSKIRCETYRFRLPVKLLGPFRFLAEKFSDCVPSNFKERFSDSHSLDASDFRGPISQTCTGICTGIFSRNAKRVRFRSPIAIAFGSIA